MKTAIHEETRPKINLILFASLEFYLFRSDKGITLIKQGTYIKNVDLLTQLFISYSLKVVFVYIKSLVPN